MENAPGSPTKAQAESSRALISRQSVKVTFPNSHGRAASPESDESEMKHNPFRMPPDTDIFGLRDKERKKRRDERSQQRKLKVHEKTTYASRINSKTTSMIRPADTLDELQRSDEDDGKAVTVKDDPEFVLAVTRDRHVEKESLTDYINKKREMFLVQYSLGVKRDEMRKLEEIAHAEERKLELAEQYLEEDAAMFDEFLKENDKNSVEAIKIAEREIKAKEEKNKEIQSMNAQIGSIKSEIDNYESQLQGYLRYQQFLGGLSPKEWLEEKLKEIHARREMKKLEKSKNDSAKRKKETATPADSQRSESQRRNLQVKTRMSSRGGTSLRKTPGGEEAPDSTTEQSDSDSDSDEEPDLYFTLPQQLLDIFSELEEQNLSLIQNSQETEEALEEIKQTIKQTKIKMEKETEILQEQIEKLNLAIKREEEKARDLEVKARMFSFGEFKAEHQEKMLRDLNKKVSDVYRSCIGDNEANISTLQMLTNIENRLEDLFEQIEMMPQEKVEAAEKAKDKERRLKMREEKVEQQRLHQEERVRRALERAKADPKKTTGRKLVSRSEPPQLKKREDEAADQATREEEELAYYFTP